MTRLLDYLFNILAITKLKNCPKANKIGQSVLKMFLNTKRTLSKWPKFCIVLRNFAKSGHPGTHTLSSIYDKQTTHTLVFRFITRILMFLERKRGTLSVRIRRHRTAFHLTIEDLRMSKRARTHLFLSLIPFSFFLSLARSVFYLKHSF